MNRKKKCRKKNFGFWNGRDGKTVWRMKNSRPINSLKFVPLGEIYRGWRWCFRRENDSQITIYGWPNIQDKHCTDFRWRKTFFFGEQSTRLLTLFFMRFIFEVFFTPSLSLFFLILPLFFLTPSLAFKFNSSNFNGIAKWFINYRRPFPRTENRVINIGGRGGMGL